METSAWHQRTRNIFSEKEKKAHSSSHHGIMEGK
jgi:hypothetical protein